MQQLKTDIEDLARRFDQAPSASLPAVATPAAPKAPPPAPLAEAAKTPKRSGAGRLVSRALFVAMVVLPTAGMFAYAFVARSPVYVSEASFAVKSADKGASGADSMGGIAASFGIGVGGAGDTYVVRSYLQSPAALDSLDKGTGWRKSVTRGEGADLLQSIEDLALKTSPSVTHERFVDYYNRMVSVKLSVIEQIIEIKARAFSPEAARDAARNLLSSAEDLVNRMNERASRDAVRYAQDAVAKSEARVTQSRVDLSRWRNENASLDPSKQFDLVQGVIASLEATLSQTRAEITEVEAQQVQRNTAEMQPRVRSLRAKEESLVKQIAQERARITGGDRDAIANQLMAYERLLIERDLADKEYQAAVVTLEQAKQDALRQRKYVTTISEPTLPEDIDFPRPFYHTALVFMAGLLAYGLVMLIGAVVRDYRSH